MDAMDATVFVVDDDPGMRKSLDMVMASAGLRTRSFASAEEFLDCHTGSELGCLLLDLRLSGMSGLGLMEALRSRQQQMPVIVITGHGDVPAAVHGMKLGAIDFLEKPVDHRALVDRVKAALRDEVSRRMKRAEVKQIRARLATLTHREEQLLSALIAGKSSKQIAADMGLSVRTVENHRAHLLAKTGAENTADLVRMRMQADLAGAESGLGNGD